MSRPSMGRRQIRGYDVDTSPLPRRFERRPRDPAPHGVSRRKWDKLQSRAQGVAKVHHDETFPGVVIWQSIASNA